MKRLFISFSGGETSGFMAYLILTLWRDRWDEIVILFANTGEENEETLLFVKMCAEWLSRLFGVEVVWVEAVVQHGRRAMTTHRVVSFDTASRKGEPYEDHIKKFGIPNTNMPHCTRELKQRPLQSYLASIGWERGSYDTAIGIRADEVGRRSPNQSANRMVYPLLDLQPTTKPMVNLFWSKQSFRLDLLGYQGNCKWCWKKSLPKLLAVMDDNPSTFDFPERMEAMYGEVGAEFLKEYRPGYKRVFFRGNLSTKGLRDLYENHKDNLPEIVNDAAILPKPDLFSAQEGCVESCEVDFEEAA